MQTVLLAPSLVGPAADADAVLHAFAEAGLSPVMVAEPAGAAPGGDASGRRLLSAAQAAAAAPSATFVVTADWAEATAADSAGFRPVLVLGDESLQAVLGPVEPGAKHVAMAPDLASAVRYVACEAATADAIGPFPFAAPADSRVAPARLPSQRDLARFFGLVVLAGTAVALGIAYFLRELYESWRIPANAQRIAFLATLQFLPEWARGLLFVLIGIALGVLATRARNALTAASARRRSG